MGFLVHEGLLYFPGQHRPFKKTFTSNARSILPSWNKCSVTLRQIIEIKQWLSFMNMTHTFSNDVLEHEPSKKKETCSRLKPDSLRNHRYYQDDGDSIFGRHSQTMVTLFFIFYDCVIPPSHRLHILDENNTLEFCWNVKLQALKIYNNEHEKFVFKTCLLT